MEDMTNKVNELTAEVAKLQAQNTELLAQLEAAKGGFDWRKSLERIDARNKDNEAYQQAMQASLNSSKETPDYI